MKLLKDMNKEEFEKTIGRIDKAEDFKIISAIAGLASIGVTCVGAKLKNNKLVLGGTMAMMVVGAIMDSTNEVIHDLYSECRNNIAYSEKENAINKKVVLREYHPLKNYF